MKVRGMFEVLVFSLGNRVRFGSVRVGVFSGNCLIQ